MSGVSFDDLVTAATVGVARKPLAITELVGPAAGQAGLVDAVDPAAALLDAAALLTTARRAGWQPARAVAVPVAPDWAIRDEAGQGRADRQVPVPVRELSPRAARLLRRVGSTDGGRGFATPDSELLAGLLTEAAAAGYVLPAPLLPALLDAAVRDSGLRPVVTGVLGSRGRWLTGLRPDWRRVFGQAVADSAAEPDPRTWLSGSREERRGFLAGLRRRDPAAGRELLRDGWLKETGTDRVALLSLLRSGLSAADEEFLEAALDDRAAGVRDEARRLLAQLPGSAYQRRTAERAAAVLRVERHALRRRLVVTPPGEPDAAAARDGVPADSPVQGIGPSGWRLIHVLATVPLSEWTGRLGLSPAELAGLPVSDDLGVLVHAGWRQAAVRQHEARTTLSPGGVSSGGMSSGAVGSGGVSSGAVASGAASSAAVASGTMASSTVASGTPIPGSEGESGLTAWVLALLAADAGREVKWGYQVWPGDAALTAVLPAAVRTDRVTTLLKRARPDDRGASVLSGQVAACTVPWTPALADAVLGLLTRAAAQASLFPLPRALLSRAGRSLPADGPRDYAAALTQLAAARPQDWSQLLHAAAETIALRRAFLAELRP